MLLTVIIFISLLETLTGNLKSPSNLGSHYDNNVSNSLNYVPYRAIRQIM